MDGGRDLNGTGSGEKQLDGVIVVTGCPINRDSLTLTIVQVAFLLLVSNLLHIVLRRLKQPSIVSHIFAGIILGPGVLGNIDKYALTFLRGSNRMTSVATSGRMLFMFVIGLEIDVPYVSKRIHRATIVALGGWLMGGAAAAAVSNLVRNLLNMDASSGRAAEFRSMEELRRKMFAIILVLLFTTTASPVLIRVVTELKLATSEIGRMALSAALVGDATTMVCLMLLSFMPTFESYMTDGAEMRPLIFGGVFILIWLQLLRFLVKRLNMSNQGRRHIKNWQVALVTVFVLVGSMIAQATGYSSMITCFLFGVLIPRDGCTARSLLEWLTFPVYEIILPIFFGASTMYVDFSLLVLDEKLALATVLVVFMSTLAKVSGTVIATTILKMPLAEGIVLGFLLNVKGHIDIVLLSLGVKSRLWSTGHQPAMIIILATNTICAGPIAAAVVYMQRNAFHYRAISMQSQHLESELRILSCVHSPGDLPPALSLVEMLTGPGRTLLAPYAMHLVELTKHTISSTRIHNQCRDDDDWEFGGENDRQITVMCSAFQNATNITVRQLTAVSAHHNMHEDICNAVQDTRASLVIMPFHKHQRIDGKMGAGSDGVRIVNKKVLSHAPCTVGVLIDRGLGSVAPQPGQDAVYTVAVLFFGGPDDREACALGARLAQHPMVSLTLVRFRPRSWSEYNESTRSFAAAKDDGVLTSINNLDMEREEDESFLSDFHNNFVSKGLVSLVEKYVENGPETVTTLSEMEGLYMLYLVGKGTRGLTQLTMGLGDWEECPELGSIGDLLASSDFMSNSSVLVLLQDNRLDRSHHEDDSPLM